MKNKALIGVIAGVVAAAAIITVLVAKNASAPDVTLDASAQPTVQPAQQDASPAPSEPGETAGQASGTAAPVQPDAENAGEKVYTPTFMYFVSKSDEGYDATMVMLEELKKEFDGKVKFDIRNIDDDPEAVKNFPVENNTPTLIMLNTKNDISNILFKTKDKDKLTAAITAAMQN